MNVYMPSVHDKELTYPVDTLYSMSQSHGLIVTLPHHTRNAPLNPTTGLYLKALNISHEIDVSFIDLVYRIRMAPPIAVGAREMQTSCLRPPSEHNLNAISHATSEMTVDK